jgi:hypothetical protein
MGWFCGSADEDPVNIAARAYTPKKKRRLRTPWTSSSDKRKAREALLREGEDKTLRGQPHADTILEDLQEQIDGLRRKNKLSPSTAMEPDNTTAESVGRSTPEPLSPLFVATHGGSTIDPTGSQSDLTSYGESRSVYGSASHNSDNIINDRSSVSGI